jgi:hypothetical protein
MQIHQAEPIIDIWKQQKQNTPKVFVKHLTTVATK